MEPHDNGHWLINLIYLVVTIATGITGTHIFYDDVHLILGIILQLCSLIMFAGWFILHWNKIKNQVRAWFIEHDLK